MPATQNNMITDKLDQAEKYFTLHPAFPVAFALLRSDSLAQRESGKYNVDGDRLYYLVSNGPGKKRNEARLEAHRKYIDIQYVIAGTDTMGWKPLTGCSLVDSPYDSSKDIEFFADEPQTWTPVPAGSFAIFFPTDAHAPMVSDSTIHKVVLKIAVEE
ncbi:MAG TPA: YhcH/YjgK/YiaL family protein [bacterium]|nr:YhcH/YjgK/YiaL family protein [bacterium]HPN43550.1 YhcH/YjgK/YiaL family protein [bacterium]